MVGAMSESAAKTPFLPFGHAIGAARVARGFETQAELAAQLDVSQQSVSRWEAGTHRPRPAQLAALAVVLNLLPSDLLRLAGYDAPPAESFVAPFPVDRFADPATLEHFVAYLVKELHRDAEVRRAGGLGHDQDGVDVVATFPDGRRYDYQCKRVARFGPAEVKTAVAAYSGAADGKFLVLSRVASPQTADEIRRHPGWILWDKDDLSRIIRQELSEESQNRIVDIFFRGQRQALLGRSEPGAWLLADDFFLPFSPAEAALSHQWSLVGRATETAQLLTLLDASRPGVVLLIAAGGMGKSRLVKELADRFAAVEPLTTLRFLARDAELTPAGLAALGAGPKVMVVDDAHDRDGLGTLFQFVANPANQARLLLASRPYAEERIRGEAAVYALTQLPTVRLERLARTHLEELARGVLAEFGADESLAEAVVEHAGDSPLTIAMAARIVARDGRPLELARSEAELRELILGKFAKVVVGDLGRPGDEALHRDVLDTLALVQPFHPGDPQLLEFIHAVKGVPAEDAARALRTLIEGGVVFKRGRQHRLMPDLLGDHIIQRSCLDATGALSPFARKALDAVPAALLANVFVNLARLDWRRSDGDPANSRLLETLWRNLDTIVDNWDPRLDAVTAAAMYQPRQALDFAARLVRRGRRLSALSEILRTVAFSKPEHFEAACELLWAMGRTDDRELGPHPAHPMRTLGEFGEYKSRKPLEFSERLLAFALQLMSDPKNWEGRHSPLELLRPLLKGDGEDSTSDGRSITFMPFFVSYGVVEPLRSRIIDKLLELVRHPRLAVARGAATFLENALHNPLGSFGIEASDELREIYAAEFEGTLARIDEIMSQGLPPVVALAMARSVSWHARYGDGRPADQAAVILANMPTDLEFRLIAVLADGFGQVFIEREDVEQWEEKLQAWLKETVALLLAAHPSAEDRRAAVERALATMTEAGEPHTSASSLLYTLMREDEDFARAVLDDALRRSGSLTRPYAGVALGRILQSAHGEGHCRARLMMATGEADLAQSVANGYGGLIGSISPEDVRIVEELLAGPPDVVASAVRAVISWREADPALVIDLLKHANLHGDARIADSLAMGLAGLRRGLIDHVTRDDAMAVLAALEPIPALDGHWIDDLMAELSFRFPHETADFFMRRVERAAASESYRFRAANHGPYSHRRLRFLETSDGLTVLRRVWTWLAKNQDGDNYFHEAAKDMFDAMFLHDFDRVAELFSPQIAGATAGELTLMANLLTQAHRSFVFTHSNFVVRFLERCAETDSDVARRAASAFFSSAYWGVRGGTVGEPTPQDLEQLAKAEEVLARLSRASPAYELYDWIRGAAEQSIARSKADAEVFDDA